MKEAVSRAQVLTRMLKGYQAYFDIEQYEDGKNGLPLAAHCRFYVHSEKYVLVKKAKLWDADSNEYVYIFSVPELTKELYETCKNYAYEDGMKLIPFSDGRYEWKACMITRRDEEENEGVQCFRKHVQEWLQKIRSGEITR